MAEDFSAGKSGFQEMIDRYSRELLSFRSTIEEEPEECAPSEGFDGISEKTPPWAERLEKLERDFEKLKKAAAELEKSCGTGGDGEKENTPDETDEDISEGTASLRVAVFTADEALPIAGADVVITKAEDGRELLCAAGITDESGRTAAFALEAVEMDGSDQLTEPGAYSVYTVYVTADGFEPEKREAQLVATTASTLPVTMTPLVSGGSGR